MSGNVQRAGESLEERTPEVVTSLNDLDAVIQRYDHVVGRLSSRLSCVLMPMPPESQACPESSGFQTELANHINGLRCKTRDITDHLESLLDRLEL